MTLAAIASLIIGLVIGYLGQRSRMCFVGGIRDFILVRDTFLLKGLIAFALTAWVAFPLAALAGGVPVGAFGRPDAVTLALTALGGFGVGFLSILANGCPFRQHVLAAQGVISSATYLAGFFVGAVIFHTLVIPLLGWLLP
ncbi:MAG: YeeE/YedE family protein [Ardenticatenaceae bacterium]|nr:YeeE/YedE family protein [Ardenticatenaceae bacterium]